MYESIVIVVFMQRYAFGKQKQTKKSRDVTPVRHTLDWKWLYEIVHAKCKEKKVSQFFTFNVLILMIFDVNDFRCEGSYVW